MTYDMQELIQAVGRLFVDVEDVETFEEFEVWPTRSRRGGAPFACAHA